MHEPRSIAVVTGSRADYGLLLPVIEAIDRSPGLRMHLVATGSHYHSRTPTIREIRDRWSDLVEAPGSINSSDSMRAHADSFFGIGIDLLDAFDRCDPGIVVVLGDRAEMLAAATAATLSGRQVAHIHGGDRAEGIADESLRSAVSRLAHIHLAASEQSAERLERTGEDPRRIHIVGSPAIDGLLAVPPMSDSDHAELGKPRIAFLMHPTGRDPVIESSEATGILEACRSVGQTVALAPNTDPGRSGIMDGIESAGFRPIEHMDRRRFLGLLRKVDLLVGNSSCGLIEAAAIGLRVLNLGPRQSGRERGSNVVSLEHWSDRDLAEAMSGAIEAGRCMDPHPWGDGRSGTRIAGILEGVDLEVPGYAKLNTY